LFGIFLDFFGKFFGGIFWIFLEEFFCKDILVRIFLGGFFWEDFFGGGFFGEEYHFNIEGID